jgi:hypothetical protein
MLTNTLPAATGTNKTSFVHFGVVPPPSSGTGSGGEGGGGQLPPLELLSSSNRAALSTDEDSTLWPPLPPMPWDTSTWSTGLQQPSSLNEMSSDLAESSELTTSETSSPTCGFYRVVRQGVHILNYTNLSSITTNVENVLSLQIEAGNADGAIDSVTIFVDGHKCDGAPLITPPFEYPLTVDVDTAFLPNGQHTFQVLVEWKRDSEPFVLDLYSDSFILSVSNVVMYQDWEELVGKDVSAFFMSTADPSANVQLDIYDCYGYYTKTLYSQATNGQIEILWDLVDRFGNKRDNPEIDPFFYSVTTVFPAGSSFAAKASSGSQIAANAATGGGISSQNPLKKHLNDIFPDQGAWTVAYQDIFRYHYDPDGYMAGALNDIGGIASMHGGAYAAAPSAGQPQTWPLRFIYTNHPDTNITLWTEINDSQRLLRYLTNQAIRNFVYVGHGTKTSVAELSQTDLASINHRYRFVYLYACLGANGSLDSAFHINGRGMYPLSHYQKTGIRPALFCGNDSEAIWGIRDGSHGMDGQIFWQFPAWIDNFLFFWHFYGYGADGAITLLSMFQTFLECLATGSLVEA